MDTNYRVPVHTSSLKVVKAGYPLLKATYGLPPRKTQFVTHVLNRHAYRRQGLTRNQLKRLWSKVRASAVKSVKNVCRKQGTMITSTKRDLLHLLVKNKSRRVGIKNMSRLSRLLQNFSQIGLKGG
jgi:hypothetical protein